VLAQKNFHEIFCGGSAKNFSLLTDVTQSQNPINSSTISNILTIHNFLQRSTSRYYLRTINRIHEHTVFHPDTKQSFSSKSYQAVTRTEA
jgi:site-specific DNA-adenine methylase